MNEAYAAEGITQIELINEAITASGARYIDSSGTVNIVGGMLILLAVFDFTRSSLTHGIIVSVRRRPYWQRAKELGSDSVRLQCFD